MDYIDVPKHLDRNKKNGGILRDSVDGENKYCRITIRRKRATAQEAIDFFRQSDLDLQEILQDQEFEGQENEILFAMSCMMTALDALEGCEG